jgi:hypothetical protein
MYRPTIVPAIVCLVSPLLLAACVTAPEIRQPVSTSKLRCDEAVASAVGFGRGEARAIAENSARQQAGDVRGYLLSSGVSRVRRAGSQVSCRPFALGGGLTQCVAVHRFCGR